MSGDGRNDRRGTAEDRRGADVSLRVRQRAQLGGRPRRPAARPQLPPARPARAVRGAAERFGVHRAAGAQPPLVAVPHPPVGRAPGRSPAPTTAPSARRPSRRRVPDPNRLRWNPLPEPAPGTDFLAGLWTLGGNGDATQRTGMAVHLYHANSSMERVFSDADGELLIVPERGGLLLRTEFGLLHVEPGHVALIPVGCASVWSCWTPARRRATARGYVCENYGAPFQLPDLGPIGANGLANARDFRAPVAAYEDVEGPGRGGQQVLRQPLDGHLRPLAAGCRRLARQPCAVRLRPAPLQCDRHHQLRPPGPVDLHGADLAVATPRAWPASTSWSSRRAGWSARTRSGRRTSTGT